MGNLHEISDIAIEYLKSKDGIKGDIHVYECETHEITMKDGKTSHQNSLQIRFPGDLTGRI